MKALLLLFIAVFVASCGPDEKDEEPVIYSPNLASTDQVNEILSDLAEKHVHGSADEHLSLDQMVAKVQLGYRLSVTCGNVRDVALKLLEAYDIKARPFATRTLLKYDGLNDGHQMLEVYVEGQWVVYDIDLDVQPMSGGKPLTALEFGDAVRQGDYELRPLANTLFDPNWELSGYANVADFSVEEFYAHTAQAIVHVVNSEALAEDITPVLFERHPSYKPLTREELIQKLY